MGRVSVPLLGQGAEPPVALVHSPRVAADALLADLVGAPDPLESARARAPELTALLLREHWIALLDRIVPATRPVPGWLAWRAIYGLHHLGHLRDAAAVEPAARSLRSRHRSRAAAISAVFLLVPSPDVVHSPTVTVAMKRRS